MKKLLLFLLCSAPAFGQSGAALIQYFPGVPSGGCTVGRTLAMNQSNGDLYFCKSGAWTPIGTGGGGAGSVTSFSSGNLSPLFTTSVTNATTAPTQTFTFTNAPANTMLGNAAGSPAAPSWIAIPSGGGGGSGTVTTFSVSNLSPIFTASVTNPTTTPALSFTLSNAPSNSMLGNNTGASAAPNWIPIPTGSGGGTTLAGCSTPTAGNFECDHSLSATIGNEGLLTLPFAGLPASVPSGHSGQLAADANGVPYWAAGNSSPFTKLMMADASTGLMPGVNIDVSKNPGGLGNLVVLRSDFVQCNMVGWSIQSQGPTCADLLSFRPTTDPYEITSNEINKVLFPSGSTPVTFNLPTPSGLFASPFVFWADTRCLAPIHVVSAAGSSINGRDSIEIGTCGWSMIWADANGTSWNAQTYNPPGGVEFIP